MHELLFIVIAYLVGSLPCGSIIYYLAGKKNIPGQADRIIESPNILQCLGGKKAAAISLCNMLKGVLPVAYGIRYFDSPIIILCGGAAAIIGDLFPVFLKFRGGKGIAVLSGVFLVFDLPAAVVFFVSFFIISVITKNVTSGSLTAVSVLFFYTLFTHIVEISGIVFILTLLVVIKRHASIKKMMAGAEEKLNWRKNG